MRTRIAATVTALALGVVVLPAAALEHGNASNRNPQVVSGGEPILNLAGSRWAAEPLGRRLA